LRSGFDATEIFSRALPGGWIELSYLWRGIGLGGREKVSMSSSTHLSQYIPVHIDFLL